MCLLSTVSGRTASGHHPTSIPVTMNNKIIFLIFYILLLLRLRNPWMVQLPPQAPVQSQYLLRPCRFHPLPVPMQQTLRQMSAYTPPHGAPLIAGGITDHCHGFIKTDTGISNVQISYCIHRQIFVTIHHHIVIMRTAPAISACAFVFYYQFCLLLAEERRCRLHASLQPLFTGPPIHF